MKPTLILITDDDEDDRFFIRQAIERQLSKVAIEEAHNGQQALEYVGKADNSVLKIILLDINMPVMDGFEVLKQARSTPALKQTPIIILSTSDHPEQVRQAYELGANCYIKKPDRVTEYDEIVKSIDRCFLSVLPASGL